MQNSCNSLVDFRNSQQLSQKEMASKLNVTLSYYSKIELGFRSPSFNFIKSFKQSFPYVIVDKIFFNFKNHDS